MKGPKQTTGYRLKECLHMKGPKKTTCYRKPPVIGSMNVDLPWFSKCLKIRALTHTKPYQLGDICMMAPLGWNKPDTYVSLWCDVPATDKLVSVSGKNSCVFI
ncbi:unnamed protein product [Lymnaea stagnalis]|uniref:Uncharacterized protein n=1 Tax=Lymnaea stagnalis TaxID=6523 RepID=A0AAV2HIS8_LYMST